MGQHQSLNLYMQMNNQTHAQPNFQNHIQNQHQQLPSQQNFYDKKANPAVSMVNNVQP